MPIPEVSISDHALVRWLERVHGIDIEFFREKLREEIAPAVAMGAVKMSVGGVTFCIEDGVLKTVKPRGKRKDRNRPPRWTARAEEDFRG